MEKLVSADLANNTQCILEYTTNNRKMLSFKTDPFDAKIVSHTYTDIGKIVFDRPITKIGEKAFYWRFSLTSVTIPDSVTTIGTGAFYYSKSLSNVTIGNSVRVIFDQAFLGCSIDSIVCYPKVPPKIYKTFGEINKIVVPTGYEEAYANSDWGKYLE